MGYTGYALHAVTAADLVERAAIYSAPLGYQYARLPQQTDTRSAPVADTIDAQLCAQLGEFLDAMAPEEELPVLEELVLASIDQHQGEDNVASEGFAQLPYPTPLISTIHWEARRGDDRMRV